MTDLSPDTPAPDRPPGAVLVLSENWTIWIRGISTTW